MPAVDHQVQGVEESAEDKKRYQQPLHDSNVVRSANNGRRSGFCRFFTLGSPNPGPPNPDPPFCSTPVVAFDSFERPTAG